MRLSNGNTSNTLVTVGGCYRSSRVISGLHGGGNGVTAFSLPSEKSSRWIFICIGGRGLKALLRSKMAGGLASRGFAGNFPHCYALFHPVTGVTTTVCSQRVARSGNPASSASKVRFDLGCFRASMRNYP